ncbi:MAG: hypothetical protein RR651_11710, partial [Lysinibacillus sp.]
MIKLFIASAIIAVIASVLLTPLKTAPKKEGQSKKVIGYFFIAVIAVSFVATAITIYVTKLDMNWLMF